MKHSLLKSSPKVPGDGSVPSTVYGSNVEVSGWCYKSSFVLCSLVVSVLIKYSYLHMKFLFLSKVLCRCCGKRVFIVDYRKFV